MRRRRAGFTLIEVLVAVVLIDVGLLALVAGSAVLVRQAAELRMRNAALRAATNRVQFLGAGPCLATAGGAGGSNAGALREEWSVSLQANNVREVLDRVTFTVGGDTRAVVLRTRLPC
jgi:prepilin-type N-terminal cleavage/methylation domain-containing protein